MTRSAPLLALALLTAVLAGCFSSDRGGDDPGEPVVAGPVVDEQGRTVTRIDVGDGAIAEVHAAAGALSEVRAEGTTIQVVLPRSAWILDGRAFTSSQGAFAIEPGENLTFLLAPFAETFELVAGGPDAVLMPQGSAVDPNDPASVQNPSAPAGFDANLTYNVTSPYNGTAAFVSGARVYELMEVQRAMFPHRTPGMPNYVASQEYFAQFFTDLGYPTVMQDEYGINAVPGLPVGGIHPGSLVNVWAYRPGTGTPDRIIAFGGHYDMVEETRDAAFDDTSGTIMTMVLAEAFSRIDTDVGLLFGLWGGEEDGLVGSNFWVRTHPDLVAQIALYVNLDVAAMAWPGPTGAPDPILVSAGPDGPSAVHLLEKAASLYAAYVPEMPPEMQIYEPIVEGQTTGQGRVNLQSDHTSFVSEGVPVYFPFTGNVDYALNFIHDVTDTLYNMTYYMATQEPIPDADGNTELNATDFDTGRLLLERSFETFMALPFYITIEIDAGKYDPPIKP